MTIDSASVKRRKHGEGPGPPGRRLIRMSAPEAVEPPDDHPVRKRRYASASLSPRGHNACPVRHIRPRPLICDGFVMATLSAALIAQPSCRGGSGRGLQRKNKK